VAHPGFATYPAAISIEQAAVSPIEWLSRPPTVSSSRDIVVAEVRTYFLFVLCDFSRRRASRRARSELRERPGDLRPYTVAKTILQSTVCVWELLRFVRPPTGAEYRDADRLTMGIHASCAVSRLVVKAPFD
jgi:hypothetical protein